MKLAAYQEHVTRLCFAQVPAETDLEALNEHGHRDRWVTYRNMVRGRFERVVRTAFPRTADRLAPDFGAHFSDWLATMPPSTPLFREVPLQFADFLQPKLPPDLADLLRFETAVWDLKAVPSPTETALPLSFERPIVLTPAMVTLSTDHMVHREGPRTLEAGEWRLVLYRNPSFRVVTLTVNGLAFDLMKRFGAPHETLADAVREVAESRGTVMGPKFMESLGGLLADYVERGIILGSR